MVNLKDTKCHWSPTSKRGGQIQSAETGFFERFVYYRPVGENEQNLTIMRSMDDYYLKHPSSGILRMSDLLFSLGIVANHKRVRRLLCLICLMAIFTKKNLSKLSMAKYIRHYFLRKLEINRPNQVWAINLYPHG